MTSNSWNFPNSRMKEIFGRNFHFVLGEHELIGGRSRTFSKNFGNSWKWRQIPGIFQILERKNFWPKFPLCIRRTWVDRRSFENFFLEFRQFLELLKFLEMTSNFGILGIFVDFYIFIYEILYTYLFYLPFAYLPVTAAIFSSFLSFFFNSSLNSKYTYLFTYLLHTYLL